MLSKKIILAQRFLGTRNIIFESYSEQGRLVLLENILNKILFVGMTVSLQFNTNDGKNLQKSFEETPPRKFL